MLLEGPIEPGETHRIPGRNRLERLALPRIVRRADPARPDGSSRRGFQGALELFAGQSERVAGVDEGLQPRPARLRVVRFAVRLDRLAQLGEELGVLLELAAARPGLEVDLVPQGRELGDQRVQVYR